MSLSVRRALRYPFATPETKKFFWILTLVGFVPGLGTVFLGPVATAAVSVLTIERNEGTVLASEEFLTRTLRALVAGLLTSLYFIPVILGLAFLGFTFFQRGDITWPAMVLGGYGLLVAAALPLAVLHAVTTKNVWAALYLPQLAWLSLKGHFAVFFKLFVISACLVILKVTVGFLSLVGVGLLLVPIKAYAEYVFQYTMAHAYLDTLPISRNILGRIF